MDLLPRRRGPPRGDLRPPRRARDRAPGRARAPRSRSGRPPRRSVSVVGDLNCWDPRLHPMRSLGSSGIWELFVPQAGEGTNYKYEITGPDGDRFQKADPYAFQAELRRRPRRSSTSPSTSGATRTGWRSATRARRSTRPTIGELDLHLARRGPPRGAVGAPRRARARARRRRAARRSPSGRRPARAVSRRRRLQLLGRAHRTRCARSAPPASGSCSCPASARGARYKYEILAPDGEIRLKADPVAFETEVPPKTASVVHEPKHEWADEEWLAERPQSRAARRARCRSTRSTSARGG